ncbi:MAG TPA: polyprenyl synthetase family protein [Bacteroidales bacterium]|nr:polyprenyl synthetase family protein [Bacteroidales bacterium]HPJ59313.1 polyprenyl synthetase family protein [Bacteroidales bacterium]HRW83934.1 polyprenyl synthetase family protein [Bacteroidales bacterium]
MYNQAHLKELVDKALANYSYNCEAERLIDPIKYILSQGGKRLRPVLALMACNLFTDKIDPAVIPASGIEVFHNFTLVHDDIMDQADLRRSLPTVHRKWNTNQAILSGDVMAFVANEFLLHTPPQHLLKVLRVFNKTAIEVCVGQQLDMDFEKTAFVRQEEYMRMIELKTAVLISAAMKIGAIIGAADDKDSDLLYEFGKNLGLAFQIQDDLLDVWGDVKVFGKKSGNDIVSNKKSFPLVRAMETGSKAQIKILQSLLTDKEIDPSEKISKTIEIFDQLNIRDNTEILAYDYINKAFGYLSKVNIDETRKKEMTNLAISLIGRKQ